MTPAPLDEMLPMERPPLFSSWRRFLRMAGIVVAVQWRGYVVLVRRLSGWSMAMRERFPGRPPTSEPEAVL